VVAVDEVPEPVTEQVAGPPATVNAPAGTFTVRETCVPETVPVSVPVIDILLGPASSTNAPVATLPFCVAAQVTGVAAPFEVLVVVPDQLPAKLSVGEGAGEGAVLDELPHAEVRNAANNAVRAGVRTLIRNMDYSLHNWLTAKIAVEELLFSTRLAIRDGTVKQLDVHRPPWEVRCGLGQPNGEGSFENASPV